MSSILAVQICVLQTVQQTPVTAEYGVSGTTYAPEGVICDNEGAQVVFFFHVCRLLCGIFTLGLSICILG